MIEYLIVLLFFCQQWRILHSKKIEGDLITDKDWVFLTRFCFLSNTGKLAYEFHFSKLLAPIRLLFYYDNQWSSVYKKNLPCDQATKDPYIKTSSYQDVKLEDDSQEVLGTYSSGCKSAGDLVKCVSELTFVASRQSWWFFAVARCQNNTVNGIYLKYKLHMSNGDRQLSKELSADEFYILETSIAFLIGFLTLLIIALKFSNNLRKRMLLHTTYKMFLASLLLSIVSLIVTCIAYGKFVNSGFENFDLKVIGKAIMICSQIVFLLMLLLLSKGYNVTRGRLSQSTSLKIFVFISIYSIIHVILFFSHVFSDPGLVLYLYESVPGYGLIGLRVVAWVYFSFACFSTLKRYPEKKLFYYPLYAFYSLWFLVGPLFVLIALYGIESYQREKIVNGIELSISFLSFIYLLFLTRPSHSNKNFPYHVRTSQVGIMEERSEMDDTINFKSSSYAPSSGASPTAPDFRNLFDVVRNVYSQSTPATKVINFESTSDDSTNGCSDSNVSKVAETKKLKKIVENHSFKLFNAKIEAQNKNNEFL